MAISRKKDSAQTKVKMALEVLKGKKTIGAIEAKYGMHATQVNLWKKIVLAILPFSTTSVSILLKLQVPGQWIQNKCPRGCTLKVLLFSMSARCG